MVISTNNTTGAETERDGSNINSERIISETFVEMRNNLREDLKMIKEIKW